MVEDNNLDDDMMTIDLDDDMVTEEIDIDAEIPTKSSSKKSGRKNKNKTVRTKKIDDGNDEVESRDESPVKNRGKSTSGLTLIWIIVLLVVTAGMGFAYYPTIAITMHFDKLAKHSSDPSVDLKSTRLFIFTTDEVTYKEYIQRLKQYRSLDGSTRQIYAVRIMTQHILCVYNNELDVKTDNPDLNVEQAIGTYNHLTQFLTDFEDIILNENPNEDLFNEIAHSFTVLSMQEECVDEVCQLIIRLIANHKEVNYYRRQVLTKILELFDDSVSTQRIMVLLKSLQGRENPNEKEFGNDLDGPNRLLLAGFLWDRFIDEVNSTNPSARGAPWSDQIARLNAFVDLWINDRDQRVRRLSYDNFSRLYGSRAQQLWCNMLLEKGEEFFNYRNLAITMLRRQTGKIFEFDPFDESSNNKEWQEYLDNNPAPLKEIDKKIVKDIDGKIDKEVDKEISE